MKQISVVHRGSSLKRLPRTKTMGGVKSVEDRDLFWSSHSRQHIPPNIGVLIKRRTGTHSKCPSFRFSGIQNSSIEFSPPAICRPCKVMTYKQNGYVVWLETIYFYVDVSIPCNDPWHIFKLYRVDAAHMHDTTLTIHYRRTDHLTIHAPRMR